MRKTIIVLVILFLAIPAYAASPTSQAIPETLTPAPTADAPPVRPDMKPATYTATAHARPPKATQTPYPAPYPEPYPLPPYPEPDLDLPAWLHWLMDWITE